MKKYWTIYKISWSRMLEYRFNFFLGRLRNIIFLILLFYVWRSLSIKSGSFAGYSSEEIITYVFLVNLVRSIVFGSANRDMASEINDGIFSKYLIQPINHFWFQFFRELAERSVNFLSATFEVIFFSFILKVNFVWQSDLSLVLLFIASVIFSVFLYYILSYLVSMIAFWSREAMGPRFLYEWILDFSSGSYFPLDILSQTLQLVLMKLPFFYIIFFPISIYLGKFSVLQISYGFINQLFWILFASVFTYSILGIGVKKYNGEGI